MKKIEPPPAVKTYIEYISYFIDTGMMDVFTAIHQNGIVKKINEEYLYLDRIKYKVPAMYKEQLDPAYLWAMVKQARLQERRLVEVAGHFFYFSNVDSLQEQLHYFDLNLGGQQSISETDRHQYLLGSIMEESIASSQIEGAVTSRVVAKEMLRKERPPRNVSERMIVNNYQAIQYIDAHKSDRLTAEDLLTIHRLMTDQTLDNPEEVGQFRQKDDVYVVDVINGELIHTPPGFASIPTFVDELCRFFNDELPDYFLHPVVKASIIHFLIGYFHPFTDGNGRTARALFYWYMLRKGYWLTEYLSISRVIKESRGQYYRAFQYTELDENDLTYFVLYQVKTLSKAYDELTKYLARKQEEKRAVLLLQQSEKLSPRQAKIVDWMRQQPNISLSAKEVENRLGVSNQTARTDIQALIQAGYLDELVINRKERHYVRGPKLTGKEYPS